MKKNITDFILAIVFILALGAIPVAFFAGSQFGEQQYIHAHCMAYPFLLLNAQQWMACQIP